MKLTALFILAYFAAIFVSLRMRRKDVHRPGMHLLRAFFPNWRFYHAVGHRPTLEIRLREKDRVWQAWQPYFPRARRRIFALLHNPQTNLLLVQQSLVEHLAGDLAELSDEDDVADLVSYQLVLRLVHEMAMARQAGTDSLTRPASYQSRVRLVHPFGAENDNPTVLISPTISNSKFAA